MPLLTNLDAIARAAAERRCAANAAGVKTGSLSTPTAPEAALQQQRHTSSESGLAHTITVSPSKRLDKIQLLNIQPSTAQVSTHRLVSVDSLGKRVATSRVVLQWARVAREMFQLPLARHQGCLLTRASTA